MGILSPEKSKLEISRLYCRDGKNEPGDYAIKINGAVFGFINAQTEAQFVLVTGQVLKAGVHVVEHLGTKLKVDVKDISPDTTFYDPNRVEPEYREMMRLAKRPIGPYEAQEIRERIAKANAHNEKTKAEILNRVVVVEA